MPAHGLGGVKRPCQELEAGLAELGRRQVNLDPGLLSADGLVLISRKSQGHRLALSEGLWGEVALWFHHGDFHHLPWTYPDYAGEELRHLFRSLHGRYLWQLKQERA